MMPQLTKSIIKTFPQIKCYVKKIYKCTSSKMFLYITKVFHNIHTLYTCIRMHAPTHACTMHPGCCPRLEHLCCGQIVFACSECYLFQRQLSTNSYLVSEDLEYVLLKHDVEMVIAIGPLATHDRKPVTLI